MNTINFNRTGAGGFPLNANILGKLQEAYSIFNALGSIVGDKGIISGCQVTGSSVSDGVVYIDGEVLKFEGGIAQTKVIVKEDQVSIGYEYGNSYPDVKTRYATFGTGISAVDWADFKRGFETKNLAAVLQAKTETTDTAALLQRIELLEARPMANVPIGMIAIWDRPANEIPAGWVEFEELAGRMPIGFDSTDDDFDVVGNEGGNKTKTLDITEIPPHSHSVNPYAGVNGNYALNINSVTTPSATGNKTGEIGGGQAFSIMNPYRTVHFIKYTGVVAP